MIEKPSAVGEAAHLQLQSTSKQSQIDSAKRTTHGALCCWIILDWGEEVGSCEVRFSVNLRFVKAALAAFERGGRRRRSNAQVGPGPLLGPIFLKPSPGSLHWSSFFAKVGRVDGGDEAMHSFAVASFFNFFFSSFSLENQEESPAFGLP